MRVRTLISFGHAGSACTATHVTPTHNLHQGKRDWSHVVDRKKKNHKNKAPHSSFGQQACCGNYLVNARLCFAFANFQRRELVVILAIAFGCLSNKSVESVELMASFIAIFHRRAHAGGG
jgi:hypothetical protein